MNEHTVLIYTNPLTKAFWESGMLFPILVAATTFIACVVLFAWTNGALMKYFKPLRTKLARDVSTYVILAISAVVAIYAAMQFSV